MKNKIMNKMRRLSVILALLGMTIGILFPLNYLQRVAAEEKTPLASEIIKPSVEEVEQQMSKTPVEFEENRGQFDKNVRFMARAAGSTIFLTADEVVYVLPMSEPSAVAGGLTATNENIRMKDEIKSEDQKPRLAFALRMKLVGANTDSTFAGEETVEHRTNYFKGSHESNWQTNVPNHNRVRYENVYDGIGMVWHGRENGATQYDFVVAPNADAGQISLEFDGADNLEIDTEGNLLIHTPAGIVKQNKPFTYQETDGVRQEVSSGFVIEQSQIANCKSQIKFALGEYDRTKPLTIDPLAYSTFLGGGSNEQGNAIAVDSTGNAYITGQTTSAFYPTTAGTFDTTWNNSIDVFVTKLNAAGSALVYSTFIGGNSTDIALAIAVDSTGNTYITGYTQSGNYPTTAGTFDTTFDGVNDAIVTKLDASGSTLIYSTYIGGINSEGGYDIAIDSSGNAYLACTTFSSNFPTTAGAFDTTINGSNDAAVTKLNAAGSALIYSTFIGGSGDDRGYSIAIDSNGNAYLTGFAGSTYPTTAGAFDTTFNGGSNDAIVTKLNAAGSALVYSTFIGGASGDEGNSIAIDSTGNAYLTGFTGSSTYPTTAGAFDTTYNGATDVFVTKLNAGGSGPLIYSTFIGGSGDDSGGGIAIDSNGIAYLTGFTVDDVTDYPTTAGAFDTTHNGSNDVFVTKLIADGSALLYSTFIGGGGSDAVLGIAIDSTGNAYLTGFTTDVVTDYPTTAGAFDTTHNGLVDVFVTKLDSLAPTAANVSVGGRVTANGRGVSKASVVLTDATGASRSALTNPFGYYRFAEVPAGQTIFISVRHKQFEFAPQIIYVIEDTDSVNFTLNQK